MGLMDNIKKAQEMAQQATQQGGAGAMSPSAGDAEYANLAMKLNQGGLPGVATISSISESGAGSDPVNKAYDIGVSVALENGQSYDTTVHQYLTQDAVNAYQPGGKFQIKADPDDTSKVMLYGQA
ncbi:MAG: hypothetical protein QOD14_2138 [Solirubrobacterales bacterium]|jgi:hypothetical protein|nr:hypothetical protein [Solirubrobacterales bacterium]